MSSNKNKPQWLIDAEKAMQEFKETKYANMSDGKLAQINALHNWKKHNKDLVNEYRKKATEARTSNKQLQSNSGKIGGSNTAKKRKEEGYFESKEWKENQSKGGKIQGSKNVESGHWAKVSKKGVKASHKEIECPVCKVKGSTRNIKQSHFDKCIYPIIQKIIESHLPNEKNFSITVLIKSLMKEIDYGYRPIEVALKRFFLIPGEKSRYAKWQYSPIKNGEDPRPFYK